MSGFAAILRPGGAPVDPARFEAVAGAAPHRSPQGVSVRVDGPVGLAHLAPASEGERQPLVDPASGVALVFDGRLDNRRELARAGLGPADGSDGALALAAYLRWGEAFAERLLGDFVIALWDPARRTFLGARDPLGIRPFVYAVATDGTLVCASEVAQILAVPEIDREPDEGMVAECLTAAITSLEDTLYSGVKRLPPAHLLLADDQGIRRRRYWDVDPARTVTFATDCEYASALRELLLEAVACRLPSTGPVGVDLSGGLDSSTIACFAASLAPGRVEAFSLVHPGRTFDETPWIREVIDATGLAWNPIVPRNPAWSLALGQARRNRDLPEYPNSDCFEDLWRRAGERGIRVLLTGAGGDDLLFGSELHLADLLAAGRFREAFARRPPLRPLLRSGLWPLLPGRFRRTVRRTTGRGIPSFVRRELSRRVGLADRIGQPVPGAAMPTCAQQDHYRSTFGGWGVHFHEMFERLAARSGVVPRHPLLDRRIVEFALALPEDQRGRDGVDRFALRGAGRGMVPPRILRRSDKADFSEDLATAIESAGGRGAFERLLVEERGWVDGAAARRLHDRMSGLREREDPRWIDPVWPLWMILAVECWLRALQGDRR